MSLYKNIVVAIDPFAHYQEVLEKAQKALISGGSIYIIYVMDLPVLLPTAPFASPLVDLTGIHEKNKQAAWDILSEISEKYDINESHIHTPVGSVAKEIRSFAEQKHADAIVIGSHGRHGMGLLLGSTASAVVHGTPCDILLVKIVDEY